MGWLGWSERQAMESDVNSIMLALEGYIESKVGKQKKSQKFSWKDFVKRHNAEMQAKNGIRRRTKSQGKREN